MRATIEEIMEEYGYVSIEDLLHDYMFDSIVPACCTHGCEVEPDGRCEHGHPSILLELGYA
jgi:hypothetical protein